MSFAKSPPNEDYALNNAYWIMHLSDGTVVYQSENDNSKNSSWLSLKDFVESNKLRINKVVFKFRSNELHININKDVEYVYFSKAAGKEWMAERQDDFFVIGYQSGNDTIEKVWYRVPELIKFKTDVESISSPKISKISLCKMPLDKLL